MIPTFAFFCFNIHQIVQIRSLNLKYIQNINAVHHSFQELSESVEDTKKLKFSLESVLHHYMKS